MTDTIHIHEDDVPWGDYSAHYPGEMMHHMRAKRFMGPGAAMPHSEMLIGLIEIDPGAEYPPHRHDAPEVYYVTEGEAECAFGGETFAARKGTVIHTRPGTVHGFRNAGTEKFIALGVWWAPGGRTEVVRCDLELVGE